MNKLYKKFKGFQKHYRFKHLIAKEFNLSDEEYRLWDFMVSTCGWDNRYKDSYQVVEATLEHISEYLLWSKSKTSRTMIKLIKKNIITKDKILGYIVNLKIVRGSEETDKNLLKIMGIRIAELENYFLPAGKDVSSVKQKHSYKPIPSLVSSNGNLVSLDGDVLPNEDKQWIKDNL